MAQLAENEVRAVARYVGMSPQKVRLVADLVRGKNAKEALELLRFTPKAAAEPISKVIASAIANAVENKQLADSDLVISQIYVNGGRPVSGGALRLAGAFAQSSARARISPLCSEM
jgi:large subunit ribosomal protein L22